MSKNSFHCVLLPIDGSAHADRAAGYLARYAGALGIREIHLLNVQSAEEQAAHTASGADGVDFTELGKSATASARGTLDAAKVAYGMTTVLGEPAEVIVRTAEEEQVDEIVMGSRGMGQMANLVGSVAYKVVHRARIPVTIVVAPSPDAARHSTALETVHRILLAVDGSEHAARAVSYVCGLRGAPVPIEVQLLNVPLPLAPGYVRGVLSEDMIDSYHREEREKALAAATTALQAAGLKFDVHVVPGNASEKIVEMAGKLQCARIVMGTRGLNSFVGLLLGSVAYKVIHLSSLPVTLVK